MTSWNLAYDTWITGGTTGTSATTTTSLYNPIRQIIQTPQWKAISILDEGKPRFKSYYEQLKFETKEWLKDV